MVHTYEVWVDIKEYLGLPIDAPQFGTTRYEVDAESKAIAHRTARNIARTEHPACTECDVRVTRLIR
jgi:hypothetical protein